MVADKFGLADSQRSSYAKPQQHAREANLLSKVLP
jgi:hypothetical protein